MKYLFFAIGFVTAVVIFSFYGGFNTPDIEKNSSLFLDINNQHRLEFYPTKQCYKVLLTLTNNFSVNNITIKKNN